MTSIGRRKIFVYFLLLLRYRVLSMLFCFIHLKKRVISKVESIVIIPPSPWRKKD